MQRRPRALGGIQLNARSFINLSIAFSGILISLPTIHRAAAVAESTNLKAMVFVRPVQTTELYDLYAYPARVVPKINTTILAEADGIVSKIFCPLGQHVSRGQKLMMITHTDPIYQYAPVSVVAPVSGIVSVVEITEGSQVSKGQKLASVTDPARLRIAVEIPAQDVSKLSKGLAGEFQLEGKSVPIKIHGISPFVDPATGTASCEIELQSKDRSLPLSPGVIGQVSFKTGLRNGISIPDYAIFYKGGQTFVRVLENGKAKHVAVKLGSKQRGYVEVLNGLTDSAALIERTSRFVADGEEVAVQKADPNSGDSKI